MSAVRTFLSVPALLLALSSLAGCYDLSDPSGPRREDFVNDPSANGTAPDGEKQGEQAQAQRTDQAVAATRATATQNQANDPSSANVLAPAGTDLLATDYVARYIHPASDAD